MTRDFFNARNAPLFRSRDRGAPTFTLAQMKNRASKFVSAGTDFSSGIVLLLPQPPATVDFSISGISAAFSHWRQWSGEFARANSFTPGSAVIGECTPSAHSWPHISIRPGSQMGTLQASCLRFTLHAYRITTPGFGPAASGVCTCKPTRSCTSSPTARHTTGSSSDAHISPPQLAHTVTTDPTSTYFAAINPSCAKPSARCQRLHVQTHPVRGQPFNLPAYRLHTHENTSRLTAHQQRSEFARANLPSLATCVCSSGMKHGQYRTWTSSRQSLHVQTHLLRDQLSMVKARRPTINGSGSALTTVCTCKLSQPVTTSTASTHGTWSIPVLRQFWSHGMHLQHSPANAPPTQSNLPPLMRGFRFMGRTFEGDDMNV